MVRFEKPLDHRAAEAHPACRMIQGLFKTNQMAMLIVTIAMTAWTTNQMATADDDDDHGGNDDEMKGVTAAVPMMTDVCAE